MTKFRSILFSIYLVWITFFITLTLWPLLFFRDVAHKAGWLWRAWSLWGLKVICGISYEIKGRENIIQGEYLYAANHQSMWETIAISHQMDRPCFILKKELIDIPVFGWWCKAHGFIGIDRTAGVKAITNMTELAKERLAEGAQLIIFPEGTRQEAGKMGRMNPGVAAIYMALDIPCVPVAHDAGYYWTYPGIIKKSGTITLSFMDAIPTGMKRKAFMDLLTATIRDKIADIEMQKGRITPTADIDAADETLPNEHVASS